jgi:hypothetical protein
MVTWRIHLGDEWYDTTVKREPEPEKPLQVQRFYLRGQRPDTESIEASCFAGGRTSVERRIVPGTHRRVCGLS